MPKKRFTVVIADPLPKDVQHLFSIDNINVIYAPEISEKELKKQIKHADGLIIRSRMKVSASLIESSRLRVIGRAGTGVDNVDIKAATEKGVLVMNTPGANSVSVAEHTIAMMLAMMRNIPQASAALKSGVWDRKSYQGTELYGKTISIIGLGKIGKEVARRLKAFGVHVLAYDPYVAEEVARELEVELTDLKTALQRSDVISLHMPLNKETYHFLNSQRLSWCKKGVKVVNCARGALIDEEALLKALQSKRVGACALDVFSQEPPENKKLINHPCVITTPHLSASTQEAQERVAYEIAKQVIDYLKRGVIRHAVNFPSISPEEYEKLAPYLRLAYLLGSFASQISSVRLSEIGIRFYGELTEINTKPLVSATVFGIMEVFMSETVNIVNALTLAKERGIRIVETKSSRMRGINNVLSLQLRGEKTEWIEGSVFPTEQRSDLFPRHAPPEDLRVISIDGIPVEAPFSPHMLFVRNKDVPGVVGAIGQTLGRLQINIGNFALGRDAPMKNALAIINLDSPCSQEAIQQLLKLKPVTVARSITLKGF